MPLLFLVNASFSHMNRMVFVGNAEGIDAQASFGYLGEACCKEVVDDEAFAYHSLPLCDEAFACHNLPLCDEAYPYAVVSYHTAYSSYEVHVPYRSLPSLADHPYAASCCSPSRHIVQAYCEYPSYDHVACCKAIVV